MDKRAVEHQPSSAQTPRAAKPNDTRFQPGRSGNPKGRPPKKNKPAPVDVAGILDEAITVTKAGAPRTMSAFEASVRRLVSQAVKGDVPAISEFLQLCEEYGAIAPAPPSEPTSGVLVVPRSWERDEWLKMFERHGPPPWPGPRSGLPGS